MGVSHLTVMHPDITHDSLHEYAMRQCSARVGVLIAILHGVMDRVPIDKLSRTLKMSRQGIYNFVKRVNEHGMKGLEDDHRGRPCKLTAEIAEDLKEVLLQSPMTMGYPRLRWDNLLVRQYLRERHGVDIGRSQLMNWIRLLGSPVKLARKKNGKPLYEQQAVLVYGSIARLDPVILAQWLPEGCQPQLFTEDIQ